MSSTGLAIGDVELGGVRWRVARRTGGAGPPLLLCNGLGGNWELFTPLIEALPRRALIAFDGPGVGGTPPAALPYRLPGLARTVGALLDRMGVQAFDALGVSWGGALAQQLAWQSQGRCRRLVLAATSAGAASYPGHLSALMHLANARRLADPTHAAMVLPEVYGGTVRRDPRPLHEYLRRLKRPSRDGYAHQLTAVAGWTSLWWLPLLPQPTLILAGDDDPLVPMANARLLQRLIRRAELLVVNDGHLFLHTQAAALGPRIENFLTAG
jgi:poly(3-hydroxyalkanoate) depolymerase